MTPQSSLIWALRRCHMQMGHATAEAVVRAGLRLVPYSFTGQSEGMAVEAIGVSGIPVELIQPEARQAAMEKVSLQPLFGRWGH
jgi:4-hydroxy-tetrahydrodipicolinate reductase